MGYYKNLTNRMISPTLFGVGTVSVPANAKCVEIPDEVAEAINHMVYPEVVLERVTPTITVDDAPVVTRKRTKDVTEEV